MTLKQLRIQQNLTQAECAQYLGISRRTYQSYECDAKKQNSITYQFLCQKLEQYGYWDESHGILSLEKIRSVCADVFAEKNISYCYLFGSYAKGTATQESDVDLFLSTPISGMDFFDLAEELRERLRKRVDLLNQNHLKDNFPLVEEILKDGIKIYG